MRFVLRPRLMKKEHPPDRTGRKNLREPFRHGARLGSFKVHFSLRKRHSDFDLKQLIN